MASKREIEKELIACQTKIEFLEKQLEITQEDKETLNAQILKLQDAMMSVKAPEAYQDMRFKEFEDNQDPVSKELKEKARIVQDLTTQYINECENPLFTSKQDLEDLITSGLIKDIPTTPSLHGNDES